MDQIVRIFFYIYRNRTLTSFINSSIIWLISIRILTSLIIEIPNWSPYALTNHSHRFGIEWASSSLYVKLGTIIRSQKESYLPCYRGFKHTLPELTVISTVKVTSIWFRNCIWFNKTSHESFILGKNISSKLRALIIAVFS